jgi:hypothetical protein
LAGGGSGVGRVQRRNILLSFFSHFAAIAGGLAGLVLTPAPREACGVAILPRQRLH